MDIARTIYVEKDYSNMLLKLEKHLCVLAMIRAEGTITKAHILLCPDNKPYSVSGLRRALQRHSIDPKQYKLKKY